MVNRRSVAQLKKEIAEQKKRIAKAQLTSNQIAERNKLRRQLFELRNRRLIEAGRKARRLSSRLGKRILKTGQRIAPVVKKQARLIREQQLRDEAIARKLSGKKISKKRKKKIKRVIGSGTTRQIFVPGLGVVTQRIKGKRVVVKPKKKRPKKRKVVEEGSFLGTLDF